MFINKFLFKETMASKKKSVKKKKVSLSEKLKSNPWVLSTFVFAILAVIFIVLSFVAPTTTISEQEVHQKVIDYLNALGVDGANVDEVNDMGSFYEVIVSVGENQGPIYLTKDGAFRVQPLGPLEIEDTSTPQTNTNTQATKSDVPEAELFIWSYCPYGVTALTPFAEVAKLFGDKVDFKVLLYYDGHGAYETQQNKIQECIQKYDKTNYWDYAIGFSEDIYPECGASRDLACDLTKSTELMDLLGIDSTEVLSCVEDEGTGLIATSSARARELGVTGSPSFVVNDALLNVGRDAESYKDATCQSFNEVPEECGTTLSGNSAAATGAC